MGKKASNRSVAISVYPITAALEQLLILGRKTFGQKTTYYPPNKSFAKFFFSNYEAFSGDLNLIPEMKSIISDKQEKVNRFIATNGNGKSKVAKTATEVFIGSLFELFLKWKHKGSRAKIKENYQGVKMPNATVVASKMLRVATKSGDVACMMEIPTPDSVEEAFLLAYKMQRKYSKKEGISCIGFFPKVNLNIESEMKWVLSTEVGIGKTNDIWTVVGCDTENILRLDEQGAYIKSTVRVRAVTKGVPEKPKEFRIENPFLFWVTRKGCSAPVFVAFIDKDSWIKVAE